MDNKAMWNLELFDPESDDPDELLSLFYTEYGQVDPANEKYYRWYCLENPDGKAIIQIARDPFTNQIVGQDWVIPHRCNVAGKIYTGGIRVNAIVHPGYRQRGVMSAILAQPNKALIKKGIDFLIGLPNERSIHVAQSLELFKVGHQAFLIKPLNLDIAGLTPLKKFPAVEKFIFRWMLRIWPFIFRTRKRQEYAPKLRIEPIFQFNLSFDDFWERVKNKYPILYRRNRAYLDWRFVQHPTRTYYKLAAWQGDILVGYIVCRAARYRQISAGFVVDFLVEPSQLGEEAGNALVSTAIDYFQSNPSGMLVAMSQPNSQEGCILKHHGFASIPRRYQPIPSVLYRRLLSDELPKNLLDDIQNWFLQLGDFDYI